MVKPTDLARNLDFGEGTDITLKLDLQGLHVVGVDVGVANGVDKVTQFQSTHMGNHDGQESIAGNVEGNTKPLTV
jgi:hypothetical protein